MSKEPEIFKHLQNGKIEVRDIKAVMNVTDDMDIIGNMTVYDNGKIKRIEYHTGFFDLKGSAYSMPTAIMFVANHETKSWAEWGHRFSAVSNLHLQNWHPDVDVIDLEINLEYSLDPADVDDMGFILDEKNFGDQYEFTLNKDSQILIHHQQLNRYLEMVRGVFNFDEEWYDFPKEELTEWILIRHTYIEDEARHDARLVYNERREKALLV